MRLPCVARSLSGFVLSAIILTGCVTTPDATTPATDPATSAALATVLRADHPAPEHRARDIYRHPKETLEFFGIRQGMTVVEVWPGAGWYTEILAPLLKDRGQLYSALLDPAA